MEPNEQSTGRQAMASTEGAARAAVDAIVGGNDWRSQLQYGARGRIVNRIMKSLVKHPPVSVPEGRNELQKIAVRFEGKIYAAATSQSDYLRKISLKMLSMEGQISTQQNPQNIQVVQNQKPHGQECRPRTNLKPGIETLMVPNEQSTGRQAMASAEVAAPAAVDAIVRGNDWRSQLQYGARGRIVNRIMETLMKHPPVSVPEGRNELQKIAVRFEGKIYAAATSQSDYLRKISLKMLSMEGQISTQQNPQNIQVVQNQKPHGQASEGSTAQFDYPGADNSQEELYQIIKTMKSNYLPELSDLYNKVSMKLQHIDNHMPSQKLTEQYEKMKCFNLMLERTMQLLQMDKTCIRPALKDKLPAYERQIVTILNSQKRKPVQTSEQSAEQTPSCSTSRIHVDSAAQTGYPGAGNLHELYQMNKTLKDQYLAGLSDLYEISTKLHADSDMASQKPTGQDEQMKSFKIMLDCSLHHLQIGKGSLQPFLDESIPMYKSQITSILNSKEWKPEQTFQQSGGLAQITGPSEEPGMPLDILSMERNVKRLRPCPNDDRHNDNRS